MVVITGANNGLGLELTKLFLKNNYKVLGISKNNNNLKKLNKKNNLIIIKGNLEKKHTIKKIIKLIKRNNIKVSFLINNVGYSCIEKTPYIKHKDIYKIINTNLISIMNLTNYILNNKVKIKKIHITNVLSSLAYKGNQNIIYSVSKWGLRGYTECLKEVYKDNNNITISNIIPCSMNTSYWNNKPQTINKTNFADAKLVAEQIYNHLKSNDSEKDLFIKSCVKHND